MSNETEKPEPTVYVLSKDDLKAWQDRDPSGYHGQFNEAEYFLLTKGWNRGKPETVCGRGSTRASAANVCQVLPEWVSKYGIRSICDAGAGDLNWIRDVDLGEAQYRAFDLCPRAEGVEPLDITSDQLPACDAILCRHVLNHLTPPLVGEALERFRRSARYLIATTFDTGMNTGGVLGQWMRWDLRHFGLGAPLETIPDCEGLLALWELQ